MVRAYWREVHRQAFAEAAKTLGLESRARVVIGAIVVIAALGGLAFWGSADAGRDEAIVRLAIAGTLIGLFPFVYLWKLLSIPARMDAAAKKQARSSPLVLILNVRPKTGLHADGEWFSFGVQNTGDVTLSNVSLRALDSWFTREILATALNVTTYRQPLQIVEAQMLHPGITETREVFGLGYGREVSHEDYILNKVQQFVIEASARDVPTARRTVEYDPNARPMLRLLA